MEWRERLQDSRTARPGLMEGGSESCPDVPRYPKTCPHRAYRRPLWGDTGKENIFSETSSHRSIGSCNVLFHSGTSCGNLLKSQNNRGLCTSSELLMSAIGSEAAHIMLFVPTIPAHTLYGPCLGVCQEAIEMHRISILGPAPGSHTRRLTH